MVILTFDKFTFDTYSTPLFGVIRFDTLIVYGGCKTKNVRPKHFYDLSPILRLLKKNFINYLNTQKYLGACSNL